MRNKLFAITLFLITALMVSACSTGTSVPPAPTGSVETPLVPLTGTETVGVPQTGSTPLVITETAAATAVSTSVPTADTTAPPTDSATAAATIDAIPLATQTSASGGTIPGTPQAGIPEQFVRLSILLQSNLTTGTDTGSISGVVIAQPQPSVDTAAAQVEVPYVRYVVVDTGTGSGELLLPWQMFSFDPITSTPTGISQNFSLNGPAVARANAPRVSLPAERGVLTTGFDSQLAQYWAGEGFAIPVTGASEQEPGTQVLLRENINGTNIVDNNSQLLGQVGDFLIDPATGEFAYALFNGGQLFGNRLFMVPVQNLNFQLDSASATGLGDIQLNITPELLQAAPTIGDLNQIPLDPNLLEQLNDFWQVTPSAP